MKLHEITLAEAQSTEGREFIDSVSNAITASLGNPTKPNTWKISDSVTLIIHTNKTTMKLEYLFMIHNVVVNHHNGNKTASDFIKSLVQTASSLSQKYERWGENNVANDLGKIVKIKTPRGV